MFSVMVGWLYNVFGWMSFVSQPKYTLYLYIVVIWKIISKTCLELVVLHFRRSGCSILRRSGAGRCRWDGFSPSSGGALKETIGSRSKTPHLMIHMNCRDTLKWDSWLCIKWNSQLWHNMNSIIQSTIEQWNVYNECPKWQSTDD